MSASFASLLLEAVALLRQLPHGRDDEETARRGMERFRAVHPCFRADLLIDRPPGSPRVDYDVLLQYPEGGTVALSWRPDDGTPWSVAHAEHWAANFLVSVNHRDITLQEALLFLQLTFGQYPDLMTEIVDQALIAAAVDERSPAVDEEELQAAADEFRNAHGLYNAEATQRWLQERGLSVARLQDLLRRLVRRRKFEMEITAGAIEAYFQAHRTDFDIVRFVRADTPTEDGAARLAASARENGLVRAACLELPGVEEADFTVSLRSQYAIELPAGVAQATIGTVIGPAAEENRYWVVQVVRRAPARLDAQIRAAIRDRLFQEWTAVRRREAAVLWHWI